MKVRGYLGLDIGGTGAKAGVFDSFGKMLGFARETYSPPVHPHGFVEVPIDDIYSAARNAARQAIHSAGAQICALSISSQGQTFVSLDREDRPLHDAIIWYDSRASDQAARMQADVAARGAADAPYIEAIATAPKVMWLREHSPQTMAGAARFLTLPDYFTYRLTGEAVTDPSTAASTALYAEDAPGYCREALEAAGIDETQVAAIKPSGEPIARVRPEVAPEWNLSPDTLVVTGTNDQYAGALGAGNCRPGIVSETSGTCLALIALVKSPPRSLPPGFWLGRFPITRYQFVLAYAKTSGVVLDWFRRELGGNRGFSELDRLAAQVPPGSRGVAVLPHFEGVVSPTPNPSARGHIGGLSLGHTAADIYRAILESLAFCLRENLEAMLASGVACDVLRCIGGGAKSDLWLQIKADVTARAVERPAVPEAAVLGAAALAAAGVGDFGSIEQAAEAFYRPGTVFQPDRERSGAYEEPYERYVGLCRRLYG